MLSIACPWAESAGRRSNEYRYRYCNSILSSEEDWRACVLTSMRVFLYRYNFYTKLHTVPVL